MTYISLRSEESKNAKRLGRRLLVANFRHLNMTRKRISQGYEKYQNQYLTSKGEYNGKLVIVHGDNSQVRACSLDAGIEDS